MSAKPPYTESEIHKYNRYQNTIIIIRGDIKCQMQVIT